MTESPITQQIIASERAIRRSIFGLYAMILGTYVLIIAWVFINHFWK